MRKSPKPSVPIVAAAVAVVATLLVVAVADPIAGSAAEAPPTEAVLLPQHGSLACHMVDDEAGGRAWVYCWDGSSPRRHVRLDVEGQVSLTDTAPQPSGLGGPGNPNGTWVRVGRFRCEVQQHGVECVVIATGRGFRTDGSKITEVQAPAGVAEPVPVIGQNVVLRAAAGVVRIKEPGTGSLTFLNAEARVPVGTLVDTTRGTVELSSATDAAGGVQSGLFRGGLFRVTQPRSRSVRSGQSEGLTILILAGQPPSCGGTAGTRGRVAVISRRGRAKGQRLWGDAHGSFETGGRYASATVTGTKWLTADTCAGTLVKVARGVVRVEDHIHHRTVTVTAGHSFLAATKPPAPRNKVPVLGSSFIESKGYGTPHPKVLSSGGAAVTFYVHDIHWQSWGPPRAVGFGKGWYVPRSAESISEGHEATEKLVAFDLGPCHGKLAYRKMSWFFPGHGGHFDAGNANEICHDS